MRLDATFRRKGGGFLGRQRFGALGDGVLYLEETGVIVDAQFVRFDLPFTLQGKTFREIFCGPSRRTIPYSTVISYKAPRFGRGAHTLSYTLPDGKKKNIVFSLKNRDLNKAFSNRLDEGRAVARTYLQA